MDARPGCQRLTLEMKCAGLDAEAMARRSVEPSTMSLLGLVRYLAEVERATFRVMMAGQDVPRPAGRHNVWTSFKGVTKLAITVKPPDACRLRTHGGNMRTVKNGTVRGTRVGAAPPRELNGRGSTVAKVVVSYYCATGHRTTVPFIWTATPPPQWECRVCSQPAGTDPVNPPVGVAANIGEKTHLGRVRDRRTQAEGDVLMAESLARRDHPEDFNVWAGPRRRTV